MLTTPRPRPETAASELHAELRSTSNELAEHGERVRLLAGRLALRLGLSEERREALERAAILHDAGKRDLPAEVIDKPGPLLAHERRLVEGHSEIGETMLTAAGLLAEAVIVRHHHERWDGLGYPDRLPGNVIPLESRILHIADSYDAMTTDRGYRSAMTPRLAVAEVRRCAGTQFDPQIVGEFIAALGPLD